MVFGTLKNKAKSFLEQYEQRDPVTFAAAQQAIGGLLILDGFVGIDNPFEGKKRAGIFGTLIGVVVGIVFMFVPNFFGNITGANTMTSTTSATVVSMTPEASTSSNRGNACSLTVRYVVAGKEYIQPSSMGSSDNCTLTAGQTIPVNYNPQNPGAWAYNLKSMTMSLSLFFWAGLLIVVTSFVTFIIRLISIIFGWKLLKSGRALAKTLPQGVSLGALIEEIKQNFEGTIFNRGVASAPTVSNLSFMQPPQAQAAVVPSIIPTPIQQDVPSPANAAPTPQFTAPNNYPPTQSVSASDQIVSPASSTSPESVTINPRTPVTQSQTEPHDYPSST